METESNLIPKPDYLVRSIPMQPALSRATPDVDVAGRLGNGFRDSAFTKNKAHPLHRWVPWIAGFSAEFVDDCVCKYLKSNRGKETWVLDPFAGVGTTLVQSFLRGYNVVGFEINPYAAFASRVKLKALDVSVDALTQQIVEFEQFMEAHCPDDGHLIAAPLSKPPVGFNGRTQLFSPNVERKVLFALDFINSLRHPAVRDLFRLALGSVMVSVSNYSYEPSLTRRAAVDKADITDAHVAQVIAGKLRLMLEDIIWFKERMREVNPKPKSWIIPESIFSALGILERKNFVDLVVTSPPYLNNYHYPRNTRPQLHWLGLANGSGYKAAREDESFGKFWQTVRGLERVKLNFQMADLTKTIDLIAAANKEKQEYGGPGWANYVATYFNDTHRFCSVLSRLLRRKGNAVIVLGNSIIQGVEVKTDQIFGRIAELSGLEFANTIILRQKRTGTSIIQSAVRVEKASQRTVLYESAIVLRKK
jgi:DNA modification methylase